MSFEVAPPKYARVVAALQQKIADGTYPPGSVLPSEHQLVKEFGVSRPTVVRALQILRQGGWVEPQQGRGTFVRGRPESTSGGKGPRGRELVEGQETAQQARLVAVDRVKATPRLAVLLEIDEGTLVVMRQRLLADEDGPVELVSAYFPPEVAEGTDLESPSPIPVGIREHLATRKRLRFDHISEYVSARHPTEEEARLLQIGTRTPVLGVWVVANDASGQAVQAVEVVLPGDRHELEDTYPLT